MREQYVLGVRKQEEVQDGRGKQHKQYKQCKHVKQFNPLNPAEAAAQALTAASDTADGTGAGGSAGAGGGIGGNAAGGSDGGRTGGNGSGRKKWLISAGAAAAVAVVGGGVMLSHQADPKDTVIDAFKSITAEGQLNPSEEIFGTKELEKLLQKGSAQTGMELSMMGISDESLNQMSGAGIGLDVKRDVDSGRQLLNLPCSMAEENWRTHSLHG